MKYISRKSFKKNFDKLPISIKRKTIEAIGIFEKNHTDERLRNHKINPFSRNLRSIDVTGDVRIIYTEEDGVAVFITIGSHSELY